MSSKKNTTKTSRFQLPCTMYSTFDPQHRGPPFLAKKTTSHLSGRGDHSSCMDCSGHTPLHTPGKNTPQNLPNKNFDPPKKPLFQVVHGGFESIQKNVANFVLYFLNLAIFGKIFGKTYFWRKSRLHVLKKIIPNMKRVEMSHEKNPYYFPLYWLVNRDPYNGLL